MSCPWVSRTTVAAVVAIVAVVSLVATPAFARRARPGRASSASSVLRMRAPATPESTSLSGLASSATKAPPATKASAPVTKAGPKRVPHRRARLSPISFPETHAPPFYERGWFWPVVGGIAAAIIVTIIIVESVGGDSRMPQGSLGTIDVTL